MELDHRELKNLARERVLLTQPRFWVVALYYLSMTIGVSWFISFLPLPEDRTVQLFFQVLLALYRTVVQFGLCLWALWTYRQLDPDTGALTQGFSVAGRVILMELGIYVRVVGWYFLVSFILAGPVVFLLLSDVSAVTGTLGLLLLFAILIAVIVFLNLRYALAPYLLADRPDDGPTLPIYRSTTLMQGWKWESFKLEFSFIGWEAVNFLLSTGVILFFLHQAGLLTMAAFQADTWRDQALDVIYSTRVVVLSTLVTVPVSLWLIPYRQTARAGFYDARLLAASHEEQRPEMPPL